MDDSDKKVKLETLYMALENINYIIESLKKNSYPNSQINEYIKKRWDLWQEIYKVKSDE